MRRSRSFLVSIASISACASLVMSCTLFFSRDGYTDGTGDDDGGSAGGEGGPLAEGAADAPTEGADGTTIPCSFRSEVFHVRNPTTRAEIFTLSTNEVANSKNFGFSEERGIAFKAAGIAGDGRVGVYRLLNPTTGDRLWTASQNERTNAKTKGYTGDDTIGFYAAATQLPCLVPVYGLERAGIHTLTVDRAAIPALVDAGWNEESIRFFAAPP